MQLAHRGILSHDGDMQYHANFKKFLITLMQNVKMFCKLNHKVRTQIFILCDA